MKTVSRLLACFCLFFPLASSGQFMKGGKFIGGTINSTTSGRPDATFTSTYSNSFSINPTLGFLVGESFALGTRVGIGYAFSENVDFNLNRYTIESKSYSVGIFMAKYVPLAGDTFWFSLTGGLDYNRSIIDSPFTSSNLANNENYNISLSVRPGFVFFPNPRWGITLSIGTLSYTHVHGIGNEITENQVGFNLGSVGLGVLYFFK